MAGKNDLVRICQENIFSLIIDESTDVSICQVLAVVIRYFDQENVM